MGFTKAFLVSILKIFYIFKPSFMFRYSETYLFGMFSSIFTVISLEYLNQIFFKDSNVKYIWMPIFIHVSMIAFFLLMTLFDFYYGIRVAVAINKKPFDFFRVTDSIVKFFATIIVTTILMGLCLMLTSLQIDWMLLTAILLFTLVWFLLILYEFGSIGNHWESLYGYKPKIFKFFDKVAPMLSSKITKNLEKSFNLNTEENEKDNINNTD